MNSFRLTLLLCLLGIAHVCAAAPTLSYKVIARYPHPDQPFTQGFELNGDTIYESSGLYNRSYIARWHLGDQQVLDKQALPPAIFAEGLTIFGNRIFVLSWQEHKATVFDKTTLTKTAELSYEGEGWGLTHNEQALIMSDGSNTLRFLDPADFQSEKTISVSEDGKPVERLNELEWIPKHDGQPARILANIWQTDSIAVIDPASGAVTARLDLGTLYPLGQRSAHADVLNGIAYDARDGTLLITGKFWPTVFRLQLTEPLR